jgi:sugar phosphate permease
LLLTALCNFLFGAASSYSVHLALWTLNGLAQGMGWAPCGRSLGHWYSVRERGTVFAFWNLAVNVGGGLDRPHRRLQHGVDGVALGLLRPRGPGRAVRLFTWS